MDKSKQLWPSEEQQTITVEVHSFNMGDVEDPDLWALLEGAPDDCGD